MLFDQNYSRLALHYYPFRRVFIFGMDIYSLLSYFIHQPINHIDGTDGIDCEYNNIGEKAISRCSSNMRIFIMKAKNGPKKERFGHNIIERRQI